MAFRIFTQTDTAASHTGEKCGSAADGIAVTPSYKQIEEDGTAGSTGVDVTVYKGDIQTTISFETPSSSPNVTSYPAGTWTVPIRLTTGNAALYVDAVYICKVSSLGANNGTIASATGLGTTKPCTTGTVSVDVTQASPVSTNATDRLWVQIILYAEGHANITVTYVPDQDIVSTLVASVPPITPTGIDGTASLGSHTVQEYIGPVTRDVTVADSLAVALSPVLTTLTPAVLASTMVASDAEASVPGDYESSVKDDTPKCYFPLREGSGATDAVDFMNKGTRTATISGTPIFEQDSLIYSDRDTDNSWDFDASGYITVTPFTASEFAYSTENDEYRYFELWINPTSLATTRYLAYYRTWARNNYAWDLRLYTTGALYLRTKYWSSDFSFNDDCECLTPAGIVETGKKYHIVACIGVTCKLYVNMVSYPTTVIGNPSYRTAPIWDLQDRLYLGADNVGGTPYDGIGDELAWYANEPSMQEHYDFGTQDVFKVADSTAVALDARLSALNVPVVDNLAVPLRSMWTNDLSTLHSRQLKDIGSLRSYFSFDEGSSGAKDLVGDVTDLTYSGTNLWVDSIVSNEPTSMGHESFRVFRDDGTYSYEGYASLTNANSPDYISLEGTDPFSVVVWMQVDGPAEGGSFGWGDAEFGTTTVRANAFGCATNATTFTEGWRVWSHWVNSGIYAGNFGLTWSLVTGDDTVKNVGFTGWIHSLSGTALLLLITGSELTQNPISGLYQRTYGIRGQKIDFSSLSYKSDFETVSNVSSTYNGLFLKAHAHDFTVGYCNYEPDDDSSYTYEKYNRTAFAGMAFYDEDIGRDGLEAIWDAESTVRIEEAQALAGIATKDIWVVAFEKDIKADSPTFFNQLDHDTSTDTYVTSSSRIGNDGVFGVHADKSKSNSVIGQSESSFLVAVPDAYTQTLLQNIAYSSVETQYLVLNKEFILYVPPGGNIVIRAEQQGSTTPDFALKRNATTNSGASYDFRYIYANDHVDGDGWFEYEWEVEPGYWYIYVYNVSVNPPSPVVIYQTLNSHKYAPLDNIVYFDDAWDISFPNKATSLGSLEFWVNFANPLANQVFLEKGTPDDFEYRAKLDSAGTHIEFEFRRWDIGTSAYVTETLTSTSTVTANVPYYIVFTVDPTGGSQSTFTLYIDGSSEDFLIEVSGEGIGRISGAPLQLGRGYSDTAITRFTGRIDEIAFFAGVELTSTDISTRYGLAGAGGIIEVAVLASTMVANAPTSIGHGHRAVWPVQGTIISRAIALEPNTNPFAVEILDTRAEVLPSYVAGPFITEILSVSPTYLLHASNTADFKQNVLEGRWADYAEHEIFDLAIPSKTDWPENVIHGHASAAKLCMYFDQPILGAYPDTGMFYGVGQDNLSEDYWGPEAVSRTTGTAFNSFFIPDGEDCTWIFWGTAWQNYLLTEHVPPVTHGNNIVITPYWDREDRTAIGSAAWVDGGADEIDPGDMPGSNFTFQSSVYGPVRTTFEGGGDSSWYVRGSYDTNPPYTLWGLFSVKDTSPAYVTLGESDGTDEAFEPIGKAYLWVITYDNTTKALTLYENGGQVEQETVSGQIAAATATAEATFPFGTTGGYFGGMAVIVGTKLGTTEITDLWAVAQDQWRPVVPASAEFGLSEVQTGQIALDAIDSQAVSLGTDNAVSMDAFDNGYDKLLASYEPTIWYPMTMRWSEWNYAHLEETPEANTHVHRFVNERTNSDFGYLYNVDYGASHVPLTWTYHNGSDTLPCLDLTSWCAQQVDVAAYADTGGGYVARRGQFGEDTFLHNIDAFSIHCWFGGNIVDNFAAIGGGTIFRIGSIGNTITLDDDYFDIVHLVYDFEDNDPDKMYFHAQVNKIGWVGNSTENFPDFWNHTQRMHFVVTFSGNQGSDTGTLAFYVNGKKLDWYTAGGGSNTASSISKLSRIVRLQFGGGKSFIQNVAFHERELSAFEIQGLYAAGSGVIELGDFWYASSGGLDSSFVFPTPMKTNVVLHLTTLDSTAVVDTSQTNVLMHLGVIDSVTVPLIPPKTNVLMHLGAVASSAVALTPVKTNVRVHYVALDSTTIALNVAKTNVVLHLSEIAVVPAAWDIVKTNVLMPMIALGSTVVPLAPVKTNVVISLNEINSIAAVPTPVIHIFLAVTIAPSLFVLSGTTSTTVTFVFIAVDSSFTVLNGSVGVVEQFAEASAAISLFVALDSVLGLVAEIEALDATGTALTPPKTNVLMELAAINATVTALQTSLGLALVTRVLLVAPSLGVANATTLELLPLTRAPPAIASSITALDIVKVNTVIGVPVAASLFVVNTPTVPAFISAPVLDSLGVVLTPPKTNVVNYPATAVLTAVVLATTFDLELVYVPVTILDSTIVALDAVASSDSIPVNAIASLTVTLDPAMYMLATVEVITPSAVALDISTTQSATLVALDASAVALSVTLDCTNTITALAFDSTMVVLDPDLIYPVNAVDSTMVVLTPIYDVVRLVDVHDNTIIARDITLALVIPVIDSAVVALDSVVLPLLSASAISSLFTVPPFVYNVVIPLDIVSRKMWAISTKMASTQLPGAAISTMVASAEVQINPVCAAITIPSYFIVPELAGYKFGIPALNSTMGVFGLNISGTVEPETIDSTMVALFSDTVQAYVLPIAVTRSWTHALDIVKTNVAIEVGVTSLFTVQETTLVIAPLNIGAVDSTVVALDTSCSEVITSIIPAVDSTFVANPAYWKQQAELEVIASTAVVLDVICGTILISAELSSLFEVIPPDNLSSYNTSIVTSINSLFVAVSSTLDWGSTSAVLEVLDSTVVSNSPTTLIPLPLVAINASLVTLPITLGIGLSQSIDSTAVVTQPTIIVSGTAYVPVPTAASITVALDAHYSVVWPVENSVSTAVAVDPTIFAAPIIIVVDKIRSWTHALNVVQTSQVKYIAPVMSTVAVLEGATNVVVDFSGTAGASSVANDITLHQGHYCDVTAVDSTFALLDVTRHVGVYIPSVPSICSVLQPTVVAYITYIPVTALSSTCVSLDSTLVVAPITVSLDKIASWAHIPDAVTYNTQLPQSIPALAVTLEATLGINHITRIVEGVGEPTVEGEGVYRSEEDDYRGEEDDYRGKSEIESPAAMVALDPVAVATERLKPAVINSIFATYNIAATNVVIGVTSASVTLEALDIAGQQIVIHVDNLEISVSANDLLYIYGPPPAANIAVALDLTTISGALTYTVDALPSLFVVLTPEMNHIYYDVLSMPQIRVLDYNTCTDVLNPHIQVRVIGGSWCLEL